MRAAPLLLLPLLLAAPALGYANGTPGFAGCAGCHEPGPQPLQLSRISLPDSYTPGQTYRVVLQVTPHHGQTSGFTLQADRGTLSSEDGNVRVLNTSEITHRKPYIGRPTWVFDWTAPPPGSGPATFAFTTLTGWGDGLIQRDAWFTRNVTVPQAQAAAPVPAPTPKQSGLELSLALPLLLLMFVAERMRYR